MDVSDSSEEEMPPIPIMDANEIPLFPDNQDLFEGLFLGESV
jgi:hypothetical protein